MGYEQKLQTLTIENEDQILRAYARLQSISNLVNLLPFNYLTVKTLLIARGVYNPKNRLKPMKLVGCRKRIIDPNYEQTWSN